MRENMVHNADSDAGLAGLVSGNWTAVRPPTGEEILANIKDALSKVAEASRVIIVHPDHEEAMREAVASAPFPGLFEVTVTEDCPRDRAFLIPKPERIRPTRDTSPGGQS